MCCGENMGKENKKTLVEITLRGFPVPGAGIEPARIAPLVFETSASTDSAIRAGVLYCSVLISGLKFCTRRKFLHVRFAKVSEISEFAKYLWQWWGQICIFVR